jgi:hypothetical protein
MQKAPRGVNNYVVIFFIHYIAFPTDEKKRRCDRPVIPPLKRGAKAQVCYRAVNAV